MKRGRRVSLWSLLNRAPADVDVFALVVQMESSTWVARMPPPFAAHAAINNNSA